MPFDVVFLGTGCSSRVPIMGHTLRDRNGVWCSVCNTARLNIQKGIKDPNVRNNVSILVRWTPPESMGSQKSKSSPGSDDKVTKTDPRTFNIMVDCGKSVYRAIMEYFPTLNVRSIDSLILTHEHADAMMGLDDLRDLQEFEKVYGEDKTRHIGYRLKGQSSDDITAGGMRVLSSKRCIASALVKFDYLSSRNAKFVEGYPGVQKTLYPRIAFEAKDDEAYVNLHGLGVQFFPVWHGKNYSSLGFAFGVTESSTSTKATFVYISDVSDFPDVTIKRLEQWSIGTLVIDCLSKHSHATHLDYNGACKWIRRFAPQKAYLVGMSCSLEHTTTNEQLQKDFKDSSIDVAMAYDGMHLKGFTHEEEKVTTSS
eukprot:g1515.t1